VSFVVHAEHAVPCCRQPQATRCNITYITVITVTQCLIAYTTKCRQVGMQSPFPIRPVP
jgi:hypothetical protein